MSESGHYRAWTVAGWLGVVFGGVGVLVSLGTLALFVLFTVGGSIEAASHRSLGRSDFVSIALAALVPLAFLLVAVSAFGAGLGLLRRRLYGRTLTLVFGPISIVDAAFSTLDVWQGLLSHAVNGPSLTTRLLRVAAWTPINMGYAIAMALLCWSVYSHREAFGGGQSGARLTTG